MTRLTFALLAGISVAMTGCGETIEPIDPAVLATRTNFMLSNEPTGALGVTEARASLTAKMNGENEAEAKTEGEGESAETKASPSESFVLVGRICAGDHEPWTEGVAEFVITDPAAEAGDDHGHSHDHAHSHDAESCPFCSSGESMLDSMALVRFVGEDGQAIQVDARKLFELKRDQLIVVRGTGKIDESGTFVLAADGLYVRE